MIIRVLPLITALAPLIGINLAYWIGVEHANLPSCIPYLDGCTSISSTGRYPPGDRLFRAVMLPQAAFLVLTWHFAILWLRSQRPDTKAGTAILVSGLIGALALIIYVSYLASNDPFYEVMRRYGIYLYFVGTVIAQLTLTLSLTRSRLRQVMLWILAMPFALGVFNFVQKNLSTNPDIIENRIEWIAALLMQVWFVVLYVAWRKSGLTVIARTDSPSAHL